MTGFVSHLESALDGTKLAAGTLQTVHRDRPIWVRYDLDAIRSAVRRDDLGARPAGMWRYAELLPAAERVSLGETETPLLRCERLGAALGARDLWIKDESRLPTGSFKARGMAMAVTMARRFGVNRVALPSAGNAGGAAAAYAARAGMECFVFMPADAPLVNRAEAARHGAHVFLVDGLIAECGAIVKAGVERLGWFDLSTLREPYRIEGKKTMGLELADQLRWTLPGAILYPTGGGTGLIGMWKAFDELARLGWLQPGARPPRMFCCQSTGCDPIVRAFRAGARFADPSPAARTVAAGLRVPRALGDFMILDAIRASGGSAFAAEETRLGEWMDLVWRLEGIGLCPESAACVGGLAQALAEGQIDPGEQVVLFNTGAGQKYVEMLAIEGCPIDHRRIDWDLIETGGAARGQENRHKYM